ncbi:DUF3106 domain-containing protein [Cerasicoccus arenae]|uniref:Uncharacterized protein n=1 Tax=Cerasicoccus arenae TaxID=424488 RepID=A0A8J3DEG8_9BACT|nr:DUF3106 domain-containing protein [Cerasicoccus arenae]MBK1858160.1 DUF3106 domain-containing protein [Cerasicoccus arenae]GHB96855.1 hypothetical protein GCM10007047_11020 [Cerasicoccus arenae]
MSAQYFSPRFFLSLTVSVLAVGCLWADQPRYPGLDNPFNAPPARKREMRPPPPLPDTPAAAEGAKQLMSELNVDDSSEYYDAEAKVSIEQLYALERFLETPPDQLARIRETIVRVEAMTPEERAAMREKIQAFRRLHQEKIDKVRAAHVRWKSYEPADRRLLHRYVMSLPKEQAKEIREQTMAMSPEEREAFFQALLTKAKEAEAQGALPDLPDSVRNWRDRKGDGQPSERLDVRRDTPPAP